MKTWAKLVLVFAAVGAVVAGLIVWESNRLAAMTAETQAVVVSATLDPDEESRSLDETDVRYRYTVAGRPYESETALPGDKVADYPAGRTVAICYEPEEPLSTNLKRDDGPCGS